MRKVYEYSHLGGAEILASRFTETDREVDEAIQGVTVTQKTKKSREKGKPGKLLYSPKEMNTKFKEEFTRRGYQELKHRYTIKIPDWPVEIKGSFKQIDFVKGRVLVEVQLGKYFAMFYDMAKLQYFYNQNEADVGVEIVPVNALKRQMSSGVGYGELLVYDMERLQRVFPTFPVKVIFIDV
jgi:hypothetical protein